MLATAFYSFNFFNQNYFNFFGFRDFWQLLDFMSTLPPPAAAGGNSASSFYKFGQVYWLLKHTNTQAQPPTKELLVYFLKSFLSPNFLLVAHFFLVADFLLFPNFLLAPVFFLVVSVFLLVIPVFSFGPRLLPGPSIPSCHRFPLAPRCPPVRSHLPHTRLLLCPRLCPHPRI